MKLVIPGDPIAKCRPKFSRRGKHVLTYDPQSKQMHALSILLMAEIAKTDLKAPISSPIAVAFSFHLPLADSSTEAKRNAKLWNLDQCHKPDLDNLIKTWDFANGILWHDDCQIVSLKAEKKYSLTPCTIIEIQTIDYTMDDETKHIIKLFSPDEMSQFYCDSQLLANAIGELENSVSEDKYLFLSPVSKEIIRFAALYSKKLAKLSKLGDT